MSPFWMILLILGMFIKLLFCANCHRYCSSRKKFPSNGGWAWPPDVPEPFKGNGAVNNIYHVNCEHRNLANTNYFFPIYM